MDIEKELTDFIQKNFVSKKGGADVSGDASLLDSGLIDSVAIFELVGFIEREFSVTVSDEDVVPDNFETIKRLAAFVKSKQGAAA